MNKEDILTWLTQMGTDWVGLARIYETFVYPPNVEQTIEFWDKLEDWHNSAHITKRHADAKWDRHYAIENQESIEQYRLTKLAIDSLNE